MSGFEHDRSDRERQDAERVHAERVHAERVTAERVTAERVDADAAFVERLRSELHATAAEVEPDPAGWRQLNARIRRRRTLVRGGGVALVGAAAVLAAVAIIPGGTDPRVEFAPGAVATDGAPATAAPDGTPPPATPLPEPAPDVTAGPSGDDADPVLGTTLPPPAQEAGGLLFSDGNAIQVAGLDGSIVSTPVALGVSSQTITDVAVRPDSTTETVTVAYRVDGRSDASSEGCGDIAWAHQPAGGEIGSSGDLPRPGAAAEDCLGAPVFASDGSALGWFAETAGGDVALQTIEWTSEGPVEGTLTTFPLDLEGFSDPVLTGFGLPVGADSGTQGTLVLRLSTEEGPQLYTLPVERQADGALALPQEAPQPVTRGGDFPPGPIVATDETWSAVRLATADAEERIGLAYVPVTADGVGAPLTTETELLLDVDARPYLDAIGDTALVGVGRAMFLVRAEPGTPDAPGSTTIAADLPTATSAALLPAPPGEELAPTDGPAGEAPSGATSESTSAGTSAGASAGTSGPTTDEPETDGIPPAVRRTATAIRAAAEARDWEALGALIPDDGPFTSSFGGSTDHIAYYQAEEADGTDVLGTLADLLAEEPTEDDGGIFVWPREYLEDGYLGWRVGITESGTWIFYVAGD